jgi:hypothetical protein
VHRPPQTENTPQTENKHTNKKESVNHGKEEEELRLVVVDYATRSCA